MTDPTPAVPTDRRKVTMTSVYAKGLDDNGDPVFETHQATDYVAVEDLDVYTTDAATRWQSVVVGDDTDHGPAGDTGPYVPPTTGE